MTTIFERVNTALATLTGVPSSLAPYKSATLPDLYLVYQLIDSPQEQAADDAETVRSYRVQVTIWNTAGLAVLPDVDTAMTSAGFMKSNWRQLPQDRETGHYGLAKDYFYVE